MYYTDFRRLRQPEVELGIMIGRRLSRHVTESEVRRDWGLFDRAQHDRARRAGRGGGRPSVADGESFDTACSVSALSNAWRRRTIYSRRLTFGARRTTRIGSAARRSI